MKKHNFLKFIYIFLLFIYLFFNFENVYCDSTDSSKLKLYCNDVILVDGDSGAILYNKNAYNKVYPASTTKIMTAILALENLDLNSSIVVSKNAVYSTPAGSSTINLKPGEIMTVKDLLYGLLMESGNDAANVLAEAVSGNISDFVNKMNEKAKDLGCLNTHFANAHGFHDNNHYTTPYDMLKIFKYDLKNETFKKIIETKEYVINSTNKTKEQRFLKNTDRLLFKTSEDPYGAYYEYATGGKTGYTIEARGTFVGIAKKGNTTLLVGTFDGSQNISGHEARFLDAVTLFNYGFNNFKNKTIFDKNKFEYTITDKNAGKKYIIGLSQDISSLSDDKSYVDSYNLNIEFDKLNKQIEQNITGQSIGKFEYTVKSQNWSLNDSQDLILKRIDNYIDLSDTKLAKKYISIFILLIISSLLIILILKSAKNLNKKSKSKNRLNRLNYSKHRRRRTNKIERIDNLSRINHLK